MPVYRIPGLAEHFFYLEDDIVPIKPPTIFDWFIAECGLLKGYLNDKHRDYTGDSGPWPHDPWSNAKRHSIQLLTQRFGRYRTRRAEALHNPLLLDRCLMEEIGELFAKDLAFTTGDGNRGNGNGNGNGCCPNPEKKIRCGSCAADRDLGQGRLQFLTISQNYQVDRMAAVDGNTHARTKGVHLNHKHATVGWTRSQLCQALLHADFVNIQGTGWSDEYIGNSYAGENYKPRADLRSIINSFFFHVLPTPSRWEHPDDARMRASEPRGSGSSSSSHAETVSWDAFCTRYGDEP